MSNLLQRRAGPAAFLSEAGRADFRRAPTTPFGTLWQSTAGLLVGWLDDQRERRRSIARLQHMSDWLLRDIGIDREDIEDSVDRKLLELRFGRPPTTGCDILRGP